MALRRLRHRMNGTRRRARPPTVCFCTMAIHEPYRTMARQLCADAPHVDWLVLTDEPADFADLDVRAVAHVPTGPMAIDYINRIGPTGVVEGAAAYHDKRFALQHALEHHDVAIFLDADSRLAALPSVRDLPLGLAVLPFIRNNILGHLGEFGSWRLPTFVALAEHLTGDAEVLSVAPWCQESCIALRKDGREEEFFALWARAAAFMGERDVHTGEGGVLGLAAHLAGWTVDFEAVVELGSAVHHEGGGPKSAP